MAKRRSNLWKLPRKLQRLSGSDSLYREDGVLGTIFVVYRGDWPVVVGLSQQDAIAQYKEHKRKEQYAA